MASKVRITGCPTSTRLISISEMPTSTESDERSSRRESRCARRNLVVGLADHIGDRAIKGSEQSGFFERSLSRGDAGLCSGNILCRGTIPDTLVFPLCVRQLGFEQCTIGQADTIRDALPGRSASSQPGPGIQQVSFSQGEII